MIFIKRERARAKKPKICKEDDLLRKAVGFLESRSERTKDNPNDVFGRLISHKLRALTSDEMGEYAKLQIQQLLLDLWASE